MKRLYYLLLVVMGWLQGVPAIGQRHIKGQLAVSPYLGLVDNIPALAHLKANGNGYAVGLNLIRYTKHETFWQIGYQYDVKYYEAVGNTLSTDRHTVNFDYSVTTLHDHRRRFYVSPMVGFHGGFERINGNNPDLPQGRILNQPSGLIGLQSGLDSEWFITERTALSVGIEERYLPYSTVSIFRTYGRIGVRFSFFPN